MIYSFLKEVAHVINEHSFSILGFTFGIVTFPIRLTTAVDKCLCYGLLGSHELYWIDIRKF